jgi:hypothetical protein
MSHSDVRTELICTRQFWVSLPIEPEEDVLIVVLLIEV